MKVLFVNMPFGSLQPAIGVSLLQAQLSRMGIESRIEYLNLRFAERLGEEDYEYLVSGDAPMVIGDWIFAHCLSEATQASADEFVEVAARCLPSHAGDRSARPGIGSMLLAREMAGRFVNECFESVDWPSYDVIGFTSMFQQNTASLALARRIKAQYPNICIVFGGANLEGDMGMQLHRSFPFIDFAFSGAADVSFPAFIERKQNGGDLTSIPGVVSRRAGSTECCPTMPEKIEDLDGLPYPNYDDYFAQYAQYHLHRQPVLAMECSRGCWWGETSHCTFCGLNGLSMAYRSKSPPRVLDELDYLSERHGTRLVQMVDNILDLRYFHSLLPELKQRRPAFSIFYETKANLTKERVRLLRDAGVTIFAGIENFSTSVLRLMGKGTTGLQNVRLLKWCKEAGVTCGWNLLYGFPGEDPHEYESMTLLLRKLRHLDPPVACTPVELERFSPNFAHPEEHGFTNVRPSWFYRYSYDLPQKALERIAYVFDFDYVDGRDPWSYTTELREEIDQWKLEAGRSMLAYIDAGDRLGLLHWTPQGLANTATLRGSERELYLYCDPGRTLQQVASFGRELGEPVTFVESFLRRMVDGGTVAEIDQHFLSLAIRLGPN